MRKFVQFAFALAVSAFVAGAAMADSQNYCEMFAKDFADSRTTDVDLWQISFSNAFNDCMNQYTPVAPVAAPKKALQKSEAVPLDSSESVVEAAQTTKPVPALVPGTEAWNEYCAAKYKSFNPDTGTYNSLTGKERRCAVTQ